MKFRRSLPKLLLCLLLALLAGSLVAQTQGGVAGRSKSPNGFANIIVPQPNP